jgi:hypothetical protein
MFKPEVSFALNFVTACLGAIIIPPPPQWKILEHFVQNDKIFFWDILNKYNDI